MTVDELRQYKKCRFKGTQEDFNKVTDFYSDVDVVYNIQPNAGVGYHIITLYKKPTRLTDWEIAYICDGFFYDVINRGNNTLECWYD